MSTFAVFLSLYFFVLFLHTFTKTIHLWSSMRKTFLCTSMTNLFRTRIRTLLFTSHGLYTNLIYTQRFFHFSQHTYGSHKDFFMYTRCSHIRIPFHASFTNKNPSIQIFLLHTWITKNFFFSL